MEEVKKMLSILVIKEKNEEFFKVTGHLDL